MTPRMTSRRVLLVSLAVLLLAAAPAAAADAFKCYKAKVLKPPKFLTTTRMLSDQFAVNDGEFTVKKPLLYCNPASQNGGPVQDSTTHLTCYKIKGPKLDKGARPMVDATDEFGTLRLEVQKPFALCAPSKTVAEERQACAYGAGALPGNTLEADIPQGDQIPIDHIVLLMQENRSFDSYFGQLPAAGHAGVDGLPVNASNPDASNQPVYAFHSTQYCIDDVSHSWNNSHTQFDGGLNDEFVVTNDPNGERAMGYLDEGDLPFYYGLSKTFAIGDRFFSSVLGPTWPNRFYFLSATSDGRINNNIVAYTRESIFDRLNDAGVSYKIYASQIAFALIMGQQQHTLAEFFADAAAGTLPQVSYIDPAFFGAGENDEHPPANPQLGQQFVESIYNAMVASPDWPSSALIVTYDEHGGFYDHVPPPPACIPDNVPPQLGPGSFQAQFDRYGFRVPVMVVSPWAKPGYVSHEVYDHTSILRLIEARFNLPALTARDANATPLTDMFDFSQPHLLTPPAQPAAVIDPGQAAICSTFQ